MIRPHHDRHAEQDLLTIQFEVADRFDGWRLDHFLKWRIPRLSRNRIQQMICSQQRLAGVSLKPAMRVRRGQALKLLRPAPIEPDVPRDFAVVHQDEHLLAIDKPAGLPVHATATYYRNTLTALLRERYPDPVPTLAHRLDRETSGILLLARTKAAEINLKRQFAQREVTKDYLAIIQGHLPWYEGTVDLPIGTCTTSGIRIRNAIDAAGLPAKTNFRTLEARGSFALVSAHPTTGRQHQIRLHLAASGCPIVGDKLYGPDPMLMLEYLELGFTPRLKAQLILPRHALHAAHITFKHPSSGTQMTLEAPLPADLQQFWNGL